MPSIAVWLFPGTGLCANPYHWCTTYRPYEQYSDCSQVRSQIDAPAFCSRLDWWVVIRLVASLKGMLQHKFKKFKFKNQVEASKYKFSFAIYSCQLFGDVFFKLDFINVTNSIPLRNLNIHKSVNKNHYLRG